jgi:prepilin-type N-terminal cleavage/methylation domain-containing protein/prepilin-type processing-associated H-X9-DG protein
MPDPRRFANRGFTLIEVLVVVAIVLALLGLIVPVMSRATMSANAAKCASNLRQIGTGLLLYTHDHAGAFPQTTHTHGTMGEESWIYGIADYLDKVDQVRVCPADPSKRRKRIIDQKGSSYGLNDLVFDNPNYYRIQLIPLRSKTILAFILSEDRAPSRTRDHIHGDDWGVWENALYDVEVDRHRTGRRAADRLKGSANYLFADGHVENMLAEDFKAYFDKGINPAEPPQIP